MRNSIHWKLAIAVFDELEKMYKGISSNRDGVEIFLTAFIEGHSNVIEKYGKLEAINKIFIRELAKYYKVALGVDEDSFALMFSSFLNSMDLKEYSCSTEECVIIYPSFHHVDNGISGTQHIPVVDIYILNEEDSIRVNPEILNNKLDNFIPFLSATTIDVAEQWTNGKNATEDEELLIADEIMAVTLENKAAYKKEIIEYLAEETERPELMRFL